MTAHPHWLPEERPLVIAHRAGNDLDMARRAFEAGADMVETDVWSYRGRLELRHIKTMGLVPLLWDRWLLEPGWGKRLVLSDLLQALPIEARLFLDLKGDDPSLGRLVVDAIEREQPERKLILCGRNWRQLEEVAENPDVMTFYSVGSDEELAAVWERLSGRIYPAVSIHCRYLTPEITGQLKALGTTIVTWPINSITSARRLHELNVDGFTSDNMWLISSIASHRAQILGVS
jgi:glycerophosphoryl diester phosphodiesterase